MHYHQTLLRLSRLLPSLALVCWLTTVPLAGMAQTLALHAGAMPVRNGVANVRPATAANLTTPTPYADALFGRGGYNLTTVYWPGTPQERTGQQWLDALRALETGLKADGNWAGMRFFYPFLGNTAAQMLLNMTRLPGAGMDGVYGMGGSGTPAPTATRFGYMDASSTGDGFIDTQFVPYANLGDNSNALGVYITVDSSVTSPQVDLGCGNGSTLYDLLVRYSGYTYFEHSSGGMLAVAASSGLGHWMASRTSAALSTIYLNGTAQAPTSNVAPGGYPTTPMAIGNRGGQPIYGSKRTYGAAYCTDGLNAARAAQVHSRIQTYQTAVGRAV